MIMKNANKRSAHSGAEEYTANMEVTAKYESMVEALVFSSDFPCKRIRISFVALSVNSVISIANHSLSSYTIYCDVAGQSQQHLDYALPLPGKSDLS